MEIKQITPNQILDLIKPSENQETDKPRAKRSNQNKNVNGNQDFNAAQSLSGE